MKGFHKIVLIVALAYAAAWVLNLVFNHEAVVELITK